MKPENHISMKKFITICLLALLAGVQLFGQKAPSKFGKAKLNEINMAYPEMDSSAVAEILFDIGSSEISYDQNKNSWIYTFSRHTRIKIFKSSGYDWASFDIPLYHDAGGAERLSMVKGITYNIVDGEILSSKLEKDQVFTEKTDKYMDEVKFEMPDVKVGSVVEVSYTISSEFVTWFREWYFQHTIPTLLSEYHTRIPEYFKFHIFQKGYEHLSTTTESRQETVTETEFSRSATQAAKTYTSNFRSELTHMTGTNLPPLKLEAYTSNDDLYSTSVDLEINTYRSPSGGIQDFTSSWSRVNNRLMDHFDFGQQIGKLGYVKDVLDNIAASTTDPEERMNLAYEHVKNHMKWNKRSGKYVNTTLREAYNKGLGNAADINFILLNMLNDLGIRALPVALCTRDYGMIPPTHATLKNLNYMVVLAKINDKEILLDATDPYLQPGMLPKRCLNGQGVIIYPGGPSFISLKPEFKSTRNSMYQVTLDDQGSLSGKMTINRTGYYGLQLRQELDEATDQDAFFKDFANDHPGLQIDNYSVSIDSTKANQVTISLDIEAMDLVDQMGNLLTIPVLLFDALNDNPFKLEERKYPVNFAFPGETTTIISIIIPEGFTVDELPKACVVSLPDNLGKFMFNASLSGNNLQLISRYSINKDEFYTNEYPFLKEYFSQIVTKHAEQIILKKI